MVRISLSVYLFFHGFAHLVGFFVPWKVIEDPLHPYTTKIFNGVLDVGENGILIMGIIWLITAAAFAVAATSLLMRLDWWRPMLWGVTGFSLFICFAGLPETIIGIAVNISILVFLRYEKIFRWFNI